MDMHMPEFSSKLAASAFRFGAGPSLNFSEVVTTSSTAPWYSPSATNVNTPFAYLALIADAKQRGDFKLVRDAALGNVCVASHRFAFCIRATAKCAPSIRDEWFIALSHWPDSAALLWPVSNNFVEGANIAYLELSTACTRPVLKGMVEADCIFACEITWRSWLWQYVNVKEYALHRPIAVKPFAGQERSREIAWAGVPVSKCLDLGRVMFGTL